MLVATLAGSTAAANWATTAVSRECRSFAMDFGLSTVGTAVPSADADVDVGVETDADCRPRAALSRSVRVLAAAATDDGLRFAAVALVDNVVDLSDLATGVGLDSWLVPERPGSLLTPLSAAATPGPTRSAAPTPTTTAPVPTKPVGHLSRNRLSSRADGSDNLIRVNTNPRTWARTSPNGQGSWRSLASGQPGKRPSAQSPTSQPQR